MDNFTYAPENENDGEKNQGDPFGFAEEFIGEQQGIEQESILEDSEKEKNEVKGEWVEYLPGQEGQLGNIPSKAFRDLSSPTAYSMGFNNWDSEREKRYDSEHDKTKMILFYSKNPETNELEEGACASILLDKEGNVMEISGLKAERTLDDALVPTVEEKVKDLPGGEKFMQAFADKKELIALDKKMQNGDDLTKEEFEFLYEADRPISSLNSRGGRDPIIERLREEYGVEEAFEAGVDPTEFAQKIIDSRDGKWCIASNLDKFLAAGAKLNLDEFAQRDSLAVVYNLDKFVAAGLNPAELVENMVDEEHGDYVTEHLDRFVKAGVDPTWIAQKIIDSKHDWYVADNLDKFLDAGAKLDFAKYAQNLIDESVGGSMAGSMAVADNLDKFLAAGVEVNSQELIKKLIDDGDFDGVVGRNFDNFVATGERETLSTLLQYAVDENFDLVSEVADNLDKFLDAGVDSTELAQSLIDNAEGYAVAKKLDRFLDTGAKIDLPEFASKLIDDEDANVVVEKLDKFVANGVDPTWIAQKILSNDAGDFVYYLDRFLDAGADPTAMAIKMDSFDMAECLDKLLEAGADPNMLAKRLLDDDEEDEVLDNLDEFLAAGMDPTLLVQSLAEEDEKDVTGESKDTDKTKTVLELIRYGAWKNEGSVADYVVENLDKFVRDGADPTKIAEELIDYGYWDDADMKKFVQAGADEYEIIRKQNDLYDGYMDLDDWDYARRNGEV